jgi:preprotein translocase subunit SecF
MALILFGGQTIREFLWVMLIGIISGSYSSIGNAAQLLVVWDEGDMGRLWRRIRPGRAAPTAHDARAAGAARGLGQGGVRTRGRQAQ